MTVAFGRAAQFGVVLQSCVKAASSAEISAIEGGQAL